MKNTLKRLALVLCVMPLATPLAAVTHASAQEWQVSSLGGTSEAIFNESCSRAPQGLPDGCVARGSGDIAAAWYTQPTTRYAHAILGDAIEAGALNVRLSNGAQTQFVLPDDHVFEDRTPRLADLDGDGRLEVITILSSVNRGGSVAVYGVRGQALVLIAQSAYIGRSNRWLNVAGIADFLGNGTLQIAFVETPHIGGTLKLAPFNGSELRVVAQLGGFSNHQIRSREMRLSAISDLTGDGRPDLALPNARRDALRLVTFEGGQIREIASIAMPGQITRPVLAERGARFVTGLDNGAIVRVAR